MRQLLIGNKERDTLKATSSKCTLRKGICIVRTGIEGQGDGIAFGQSCLIDTISVPEYDIRGANNFAVYESFFMYEGLRRQAKVIQKYPFFLKYLIYRVCDISRLSQVPAIVS
jgi:hypothetical protein